MIDCAVPESYHALLQGNSNVPAKHFDVDIAPACVHGSRPRCLGVMAPLTKPKAMARSTRPPSLFPSNTDAYGSDEEDPVFLSSEWDDYDGHVQSNNAPVGDIQYCPYTQSHRLQRTKMKMVLGVMM